jgi:hypothetical protein
MYICRNAPKLTGNSNEFLMCGRGDVISTPVDLIQATVQLEQPTTPGRRKVGTGFLIIARDRDGSPRTVLITANHVFTEMKGAEIRVGYRMATRDGNWTYTPQPLRIRDAGGAPLWTAHAAQDVAAIRITAPPEFARAAIPINYLASQQDYASNSIMPGDELFVLGFPEGLSANGWGFPILRSGRVASYPLSPAISPTFLLDFAVYPGNSGGPVFATSSLAHTSTGHARPVIAGILTQQVEVDRHPLEIGIVTHARYIRETIELLLGVAPPIMRAEPQPAVHAANTVAAVPAPPSAMRGPMGWVEAGLSSLRASIEAFWRGLETLLAGRAAPHGAAPASFAKARAI